MISGFTFPELSVTLKVDSGTLTVEDAGSVLSLSPGYNSLVDQAEISFHGMATDVVSALDTSVKWTAADAGALLIGVSVGEYEAGRTYDPTTGHSYKFVNTPLSWSEARDAAKLMTYKGKSGYLPSISTASENTFVANKSGADDIWIGTTADLTYVNSARTAAGLPLIVDDTKVKGEHYWVGGAETGINYSTGLVTVVAVNGLYNSWADGEPNNFRGDEACGVTNWSGSKGGWNDLPCSMANPYLVEFDTTADDFTAAVVTFDNITGNDVDAVPGDGASLPEDGALAATGFDAALLFALALGLIAAGALITRKVRKN
jgi:hypothetical protein